MIRTEIIEAALFFIASALWYRNISNNGHKWFTFFLTFFILGMAVNSLFSN